MITKQQIKFIRSLQQKKCRDEHRLYLVEGFKMVNEIVNLRASDVEMLVYTAKVADKLNRDKIPQNVPTEVMGEVEFNKLSTLKTPQGVLAVIKQSQNTLPDSLHTNTLSLALDSIRDPGNLGTIIRIADWFGIRHIICSDDTVECYNPKVVQASMGAIFRVSVHYTNLHELVNSVKATGKTNIYGTSLSGENVYSADIEAPALLIMGNEANGISDMLLAACHKKLHIPCYGNSGQGSESLNVSVATGIVCAEFMRRLG